MGIVRRLYVYETPGRYVLLRGHPDLRAWLREQHVPALYAPVDRGHQLRTERLPDVLAAAQEDGVRVVIRAGDRA